MSQNKFIKLSFLAINKKTYWKKQTNRVEDICTHFLSTGAWVSWFRQGRIEHLEAVDDSPKTLVVEIIVKRPKVWNQSSIAYERNNIRMYK